MRYRLLANYQGAPYEAGVGPTDADVVLFAACPPPEDLHFEPATGHWRKHVRRDEVQALHESRPVGMFRGDRCIVLDDLGDRLHIAYLGHDALRAEQLGYWEVDRGVFELVTARQEVTDITEQRLSFSLSNGGMPQDPAAPLAPAARPPSFDTLPPFGPLPFDAPLDAPPAPLTTRAGIGVPLPGASAVAIPAVDEPPLPLEAEARRAAAASRSAKSKQADQAQPRQPGPAEPPSQPQPAIVLEPPSQPQPAILLEPPSQPQPAVLPLPEQPVSLSGPSASAYQAAQETPVSALPSWTPPTHLPAPVSAAPVAPALAGDASAAGAPAEVPPPDLSDLTPPVLPAAELQAQPQVQLPPVPAPEPAAATLMATTMTMQAPAAAAGPVLMPPAPEPATTMTTASAPSPAPVAPRAAQPQAAQSQAVQPQAAQPQAAQPQAAPPAPPRRRRATRRRLPTQRIFSDLASQAAIPASAYAIGDEVDGKMCLMSTDEGFEVFNSVAGARHEVRVFQDEESAYFYLFGVLVADAVRTGALAPPAAHFHDRGR